MPSAAHTLQAAPSNGTYTVLVPARLSSSRLPNKPLADLAGVPMVVRVAQRAARSRAARVVVAGDHDSIVQACQQHGVDAVLTRDDHVSGSNVCEVWQGRLARLRRPRGAGARGRPRGAALRVRGRRAVEAAR